MDVSLPNSWSYVLETPKKKCSSSEAASAPHAPDSCTPKHSAPATAASTQSRTPNISLITKFTKVLTDDEKRALNSKIQAKTPLSTQKKMSSDSDITPMECDDIIFIDDGNELPNTSINLSEAQPKTPNSSSVQSLNNPAKKQMLSKSDTKNLSRQNPLVRKGCRLYRCLVKRCAKIP